MGNFNLYLSLISAAGMILVAVAAVAIWRQKTKLSYRWFSWWAALLADEVQGKCAIAVPANRVVYARFREHLPLFMFLLGDGDCRLISLSTLQAPARLQ